MVAPRRAQLVCRTTRGRNLGFFWEGLASSHDAVGSTSLISLVGAHGSQDGGLACQGLAEISPPPIPPGSAPLSNPSHSIKLQIVSFVSPPWRVLAYVDSEAWRTLGSAPPAIHTFTSLRSSCASGGKAPAVVACTVCGGLRVGSAACGFKGPIRDTAAQTCNSPAADTPAARGSYMARKGGDHTCPRSAGTTLQGRPGGGGCVAAVKA